MRAVLFVSVALLALLAMVCSVQVSADSPLDAATEAALQSSMAAFPADQIMPLMSSEEELNPRSLLESQTEAETEADSEAEADAEAETEADADAEAETETEAESEQAAEAESEVEAEAEVTVDAESEVEAYTEVDTDAEAQVESEVESETEVDAEAEAEAEAESQAQTEAEALAQVIASASTSSTHELKWTSAIKGNGCGSGWNAKLVPDGNMGPACNVHDDCYDNCKITKAACDNAFYAGMKTLCAKKSNAISRTSCNIQANIYFTAVKNYGRSAFTAARKKCPLPRLQ